jgi:hypothetical protein
VKLLVETRPCMETVALVRRPSGCRAATSENAYPNGCDPEADQSHLRNLKTFVDRMRILTLTWMLTGGDKAKTHGSLQLEGCVGARAGFMEAYHFVCKLVETTSQT